MTCPKAYAKKKKRHNPKIFFSSKSTIETIGKGVKYVQC